MSVPGHVCTIRGSFIRFLSRWFEPHLTIVLCVGTLVGHLAWVSSAVPSGGYAYSCSYFTHRYSFLVSSDYAKLSLWCDHEHVLYGIVD